MKTISFWSHSHGLREVSFHGIEKEKMKKLEPVFDRYFDSSDTGRSIGIINLDTDIELCFYCIDGKEEPDEPDKQL